MLSISETRPDTVTRGIEPVADELPRGVLDIDSDPQGGRSRMVAITKNHKIPSNPVEARAAVRGVLQQLLDPAERHAQHRRHVPQAQPVNVHQSPRGLPQTPLLRPGSIPPPWPAHCAPAANSTASGSIRR